MMDRASHQYHVEDVGRILMQAQEELQNIRAQMLPKEGESITTDVEEVLARAESNLKAKAQIVLNGMINNDVRTMPSVFLHSDNTNLNSSNSSNKKKSPSTQPVSSLMKEFGIPTEPKSSVTVGDNKTSIARKEFQKRRNLHRRTRGRGQQQQHKISSPKTLLPSINKHDPAAPGPVITESDAKDGVLSLLNRGFINPMLDLTPAFTHGNTMLTNKQAPMHDPAELTVKPVPHVSNTSFNLSSLHFDLEESTTHPITKNRKQPKQQQQKKQQANVCNLSLNNNEEEGVIDSSTLDKVEKIRGYNELLDTYSLHQFIIRKGEALRSTPEFISFKRIYTREWGAVSNVVSALETLLSTYAIPIAYIDGQQVYKLATEGDINAVDNATGYSRTALLACVLNTDQVASTMRQLGARFKGTRRRELAATVIQSIVRMFLAKSQFSHNSSTTIAAENIQAVWKVFSGYRKLQTRLASLRSAKEQSWDLLKQDFKNRWDDIKTKRRVVVHIPSISINDSTTRLSMENFSARENSQMARLCAVADPLVDIVYVTPFTVSDEVKGYFIKLLELGGVTDPASRLRILTPENVDRFPDHFSLSMVLLYSPHCLRRIKRAVRGKEAYLVMGPAGQSDKKLAQTLNIPILGPDPEIASLLRTRSGSKRLFIKSDVNIPIGAYDIYTRLELVESLGRLIVSNIDTVQTWVIKLDDDFMSDGVAQLSVKDLPTVRSVARDKKKNEIIDSLYWKDEDILSEARASITDELKKVLEKVVVLCFDSFKNWAAFQARLLVVGCVIEALPPPKDIQGYFRTNVFIEPTGVCHVTSTQDRIASVNNSYDFLGSSFPQTLVPHAAATGASLAVAKTLFDQGVIGYASIDFMSIKSNDSQQQQRIWATGLSPYLTDTAMGFVLFNFLSAGTYQPTTGLYQCQDEDSIVERTYIIHEYLYHPNLSTMQYSSFFNVCRLNGVCFDIQHKVGSSFILSDSLAGGVLGILSIGKSRRQALRYMGSATELINKEVGSHGVIPDDFEGGFMYGNFKDILMTVRTLRESKTRGRK